VILIHSVYRAVIVVDIGFD